MSQESESSSSVRVEFPDVDKLRMLCGAHNEHLKLVERRTGGEARGCAAASSMVSGGDPARAGAGRAAAARALRRSLEEGFPLHLEDVDQATKLAGQGVAPREVFGRHRLRLGPRTASSRPRAWRRSATWRPSGSNDIVFGIGPAGTGKTYLAMAMAVAALVERKVKRIVLTRPAVEAGEKLGFLPGDIAEKVNPYLRPLYDALYDMMDDGEGLGASSSAGTIEVAPAGLHARPHAERRLRHPRRGAEHHHRADEDVPHPARLRLQGGGHRRRHPGRPARAGAPAA